MSPPGQEQLQPQLLRPRRNGPPPQQPGACSLRSSSGPSSAELMSSWKFVAPSTVIVRGGAHPAVHRLYIDQRAVADSGAGDPVALTSFLQVGSDEGHREQGRKDQMQPWNHGLTFQKS